jgi:trimethylamine---corrinoid protein Co-methyltransferase
MKSLNRVPRIRLRILSDDQCREIHLAAEQILAETGVAMEHEPARQLLARHGAAVKGDLVYIPSGLIKRALATAPRQMPLHGRDGTPAMLLGGDRTYFGTGSDTATTVDPHSGEIVSTDFETVSRFTRFTDALPNIDFVMSMGIARDRGIASFVAQFAAMAANTTKPIVYTAQGAADLLSIYRMMLEVYGDEDEVRLRPRAILYTEPISPLQHTAKELEMLMFCAEKGLPVTVPSGMSAGTTGPVTMAGALALANAETLAALVLHQLVSPGAPYLYGGNVTMMDMRTAIYPYAAPEFHMAFAAFTDLARFYGLPCWGLAGATDSKVLDAQAGAEAAYEILMAHLSGNNLIHDVGYMNSGLTSSMEMLLLCNDLIGMTRRVGAGIPITDETLALDVVHEVGPRNHFITHDHTAAHCRDAAWVPAFFNREPYDIWAQAGKKDLLAVLRRRVIEILEQHKPVPLPDPVLRTLDRIVTERRKKAGK